MTVLHLRYGTLTLVMITNGEIFPFFISVPLQQNANALESACFHHPSVPLCLHRLRGENPSVPNGW